MIVLAIGLELVVVVVVVVVVVYMTAVVDGEFSIEILRNLPPSTKIEMAVPQFTRTKSSVCARIYTRREVILVRNSVVD